MEFFQIVGVFIVLLALVIPFLQKILRFRHLKKHPEEAFREDEENEENLDYNQFLKRIGVEEEDEEDEEPVPVKRPPPVPPMRNQPKRTPFSYDEEGSNERFVSRRTLDGFKFRSNLEEVQPISKIESRNFQPGLKTTIAPDILSPDLEVKSSEIKTRSQQRSSAQNVQQIIRRRTSGREMILMHEILSPPKSLR